MNVTKLQDAARSGLSRDVEQGAQEAQTLELVTVADNSMRKLIVALHFFIPLFVSQLDWPERLNQQLDVFQWIALSAGLLFYAIIAVFISSDVTQLSVFLLFLYVLFFVDFLIV
jgi:hypothetical protein